MEPDSPTLKDDEFKPGVCVRILEGPFTDFRGTIKEIDTLKEKAVVTINFFSKEVSAEFSFSQITQHGV